MLLTSPPSMVVNYGWEMFLFTMPATGTCYVHTAVFMPVLTSKSYFLCGERDASDVIADISLCKH